MTAVLGQSDGALVSALRSYAALPPLTAYVAGTVLWIVCAVLSHFGSLALSGLYKNELTTAQRAEWASRCVSNLHALAVGIVLTIAVFCETSAYAGGSYKLQWLCKVGLMLAVSYFMYDALLVVCFIKSITAPYSTLMHHLGVGCIIHYTLTVDSPLLSMWAAGAYITEYSTPFVNARWFLSFRYRQSNLYRVVGLSMTLVFFLVRIVYLPFLLIYVFLSDGLIATLPGQVAAFRNAVIGSCAHVLLYALNLYWFYLIMRGALKIIRGSKSSQDTSAAKSAHAHSN